MYSGHPPHITVQALWISFWKFLNFGLEFSLARPIGRPFVCYHQLHLNMCPIGVPLGQLDGIIELFLSQLSGITMIHHHLQTTIWAKLAALNIISFFHICIKCP